MLLVAAIRQINEARMALDGLHDEIDFLKRLTPPSKISSSKI